MKKYLKILLIIAISFFAYSQVTLAQSKFKDLFQADENLEVKDKLEGTSFLAGNNVTVDSDIKGISFVAGANIKVNGSNEYLFTAGETLNIKSNIKNDAFIAGNTIKINSTVGRDLYIAGNEVELNGNYGRNIYVFAEKLTINGNINGNIKISANNIVINDKAKILGTIKYNDTAIIKSTNKYKTSIYKEKEQTYSYGDKIKSTFLDYVSILVVAVVLVFICENLLKKSLKQTKPTNVKTILGLSAKGLLVLIGIPILGIMLLATGIFSSLGVIGIIIYGIIVYLSTIFSAYFIANKLDGKYLKKDFNSYYLVTIGLGIIYILKLIPIVGSIITFVVLLIGIGILSNMIIEIKK